MTGILSWMNVGEVSAERDHNLTDYFYDAGVSKNIIANPKQYLLLGRKGAGKTAVFLHLTGKPDALFKETDLVVGLSLQSYNWQAHQLLNDDQKAGGFQHRDSWRFVLYIETIKAVVTHLEKNNQPIPKKIKKATAVLERIFSKPVPSWVDLLGEKLYGLAGLELPGFEAGEDKFSATAGKISFNEVKEKSELRAVMNRNIGALTNWLETCMVEIPSDIKIFLVFDRLDEAWVASFIEQSKTIISGLLHASEHVLGLFKGQIRPIVFLREDIFWSFDINDRNKFREDCSDSLRWSTESIEKLILTRINFFTNLAKQPNVISLQDLFQEKEMRSRTTPVKHLFTRTMCRPRDMVAFLRRTLQAAKDDHFTSDDGSKLSTKSIYAAEPGYSEYLYDELSDEWRTQNPAFGDYLAAIENLKYAIFQPSEFHAELNKKNLATDHAELRKIVRFLFDNSILGIQVGDSKQWRYKCFYPNQGFDDTGYLKVHPGLIKRLGLIEGSTSEQLGGVSEEEILI
jgi:hypothetical protein